MGSVSGGGVRGSESDRWKRGLLGRVDNAFFVRAQMTQVTQLQLRACLQKICMQKTHTHGMPKLLCGFCEVCSAPCSGVILSASIIRPPAFFKPVVAKLHLALSFFEEEELLGRFYPRSRRPLGRKCQSG